jgi:hypothetical protein
MLLQLFVRDGIAPSVTGSENKRFGALSELQEEEEMS